MITDKQKYALVNQCRAHSLSVIRKNQQRFLPVFNTGKIFCCDKYRYMDRWHGYAYSADEPEKAFTILYVENMPYRSLYKRVGNASKCFTSSIDKMIFDNELVPFLLFINNRFVPWGKIDIIYNYGETYLKIHGPEYYKDFISDIQMVIIPYNISFVYGTEPDYSFNSNFDALKAYINQSSVVKNGDIYISLPDTSVDFTYEHNTYNVGFWLLNQNKLKQLGLLSKERIDKLRQIEVNKIVNKNGYEEMVNTTVNIFDKDSYDNVELERLCNICPDNVLFRFDDEGKLSDDGGNVIYLIDKSEVYYERIDVDGNSYVGRVKDGELYIQDSTLGMAVQNQLTHIHLNNTDEYVNGRDILFKENFLIFKNGCLCTDCGLDLAMYNNYRVYDIDKSTDYTPDGKPYHQMQNNHITILTFLSNCDHLITHLDQFPNKKYIKKRLTESFFLNTDTTGYKDMVSEPLDFDISNSKVYKENVLDSMNSVLAYNPLLLDSLYTTYTHTVYHKGNELNAEIKTLSKYKYKYVEENGSKVMKRVLDEVNGIYIPRMKFDEDHETYPLIFLNGELIYNYDELKVYANKLFLPVREEFKPTDEIEILYITGINNNEYVVDSFQGVDKWNNNAIPKNELRVFSTDVEGLLEYPDIDYDFDNIAFPTYKRTYHYNIDDNGLGKRVQFQLGNVVYDDVITVSDDFIGKKVIAVSNKKFVYQRLEVDKKAYRLQISNKFKCCDNQKQYCLFINGRLVDRNDFLVTIPKLDRPFDRMYVYTARFVNPTDRIDLFYLPYEFMDMNGDKTFTLKDNGYIEYDRKSLRYPLDPELYMIFVNGKKIANNNIARVSADTMRITKDPQSTNDLCIYSVVKDDMVEVSNYIATGELSKYEKMINFIKSNEKLGYQELDYLFNEYTQMSNFEQPLNADVARIAIINEIIRDFWVTSGYDYNAKPFIYDFEKDDYISKDYTTGNYILLSMDATPDINIIKYDLHHLYFVMVDGDEEFSGTSYIENGRVIENPIFKWAYNTNYNTEQIEYQRLNGVDIPIEDDYEYEYQSTIDISRTLNNEIVLESYNGFNTCQSVIHAEFCSPVYYGLVPKSLVDNTNSDIYTDNPHNLIKTLNKVIQPNRLLNLDKYVIGNNMYFAYAVPKRYAYDLDGTLLITFFLPDIKSKEVIAANNDDKTTPIFTDGTTTYTSSVPLSDTEDEFTYDDALVELDEFKMRTLNSPVEYTNEYGYTEEYLVFISNGYFTRLYDGVGFDIKVK